MEPRAAYRLIKTLAELYPAAFVAAQYEQHRPLKLGVDKDLVAAGVITKDEAKVVFRLYCGRIMYRRSQVEGADRIGLDGNPAGTVSAEHAECAARSIAVTEARRIAQAVAAKADRKKEKAAPKAKAPPPAPAPPPPPQPKRLGLADLKAAAQARRQGVLVHG
jgi:ProP effector